MIKSHLNDKRKERLETVYRTVKTSRKLAMPLKCSKTLDLAVCRGRIYAIRIDLLNLKRGEEGFGADVTPTFGVRPH